MANTAPDPGQGSRPASVARPFISFLAAIDRPVADACPFAGIEIDDVIAHRTAEKARAGDAALDERDQEQHARHVGEKAGNGEKDAAGDDETAGGEQAISGRGWCGARRVIRRSNRRPRPARRSIPAAEAAGSSTRAGIKPVAPATSQNVAISATGNARMPRRISVPVGMAGGGRSGWRSREVRLWCDQAHRRTGNGSGGRSSGICHWTRIWPQAMDKSDRAPKSKPNKGVSSGRGRVNSTARRSA